MTDQPLLLLALTLRGPSGGHCVGLSLRLCRNLEQGEAQWFRRAHCLRHDWPHLKLHAVAPGGPPEGQSKKLSVTRLVATPSICRSSRQSKSDTSYLYCRTLFRARLATHFPCRQRCPSGALLHAIVFVFVLGRVACHLRMFSFRCPDGVSSRHSR